MIFLKISTKGRYALRMMADLAAHSEEGVVALKDIAARQDISKKIFGADSTAAQPRRAFAHEPRLSGRIYAREIRFGVYCRRDTARHGGQSRAGRVSAVRRKYLRKT